MSERYTKVFDLPKNMYAENAPVVISAGALLKDNQTGTILAQLKIKNITNKIIKAAKVSILSFDTVGKQIDDETKHEYLDLSVGRDNEFGQKVPIILSNNSTRSFSVTVNEIIFADSSIWNYGDEEWAALNESKKLTSILNGSEAVKQFKIEYGEKCEYEAAEDKDIWICSCGKINKKVESKCFNCGCSLQTLKNVDLAKLNENKDIRVAKEKEQATQANAKRNKLIAIISAICIVVLVLSIVISNHSKKVNTYNEGIALLQSVSIDDINKGVEILLFELGDYKDSKEQIYNRAIELTDKNSSNSIEIFEKLGDYKDSKDKVNEIIYNQGIALFDDGEFAEAFDKFEKLGDYKDSKDKKQEALFHNFVIEGNFYNNKIVIDGMEEVYNAKLINGEELKSRIVGQWLWRINSPGRKYWFLDDGSLSQSMYASGKWYEAKGVYKWKVENDELKIISTFDDNGTKREHIETYKFISMSDDVIVAYNPSTKIIEHIFIDQNSEMAKKCLKKYNIKLN